MLSALQLLIKILCCNNDCTLQVLHPRGKLSDNVQLILKNQLIMASKEALKPNSEFWDSTKTLKTLSESSYFCEEGSPSAADWPDVLKTMVSDCKQLITCMQ